MTQQLRVITVGKPALRCDEKRQEIRKEQQEQKEETPGADITYLLKGCLGNQMWRRVICELYVIKQSKSSDPASALSPKLPGLFWKRVSALPGKSQRGVCGLVLPPFSHSEPSLPPPFSLFLLISEMGRDSLGAPKCTGVM